jgi:5-deoxy-glucuronate isomerase
MSELHLKAGGEPLDITPASAGWDFCGLRIVELDPGAATEWPTGEDEYAVLPLAGGAVLEADGRRMELAGRESPFHRVSDFGYLPRETEARLTSPGGGRFALAYAHARRRLEVAYGPADEVPIEVRGAGQTSRQLNNFLGPGVFPADRLVCVEVLTPESNWSSYPPHKHDTPGGEEAVLEEIYYFEVRGEDGFAIHRTYTADAEIDATVVVRDRDAFLVPRGYHGPCIAAPGHELYYLNVLAGPGEPSLAFSDDPAHHWLRAAWEDMAVDPRLPLYDARGRAARPTEESTR